MVTFKILKNFIIWWSFYWLVTDFMIKIATHTSKIDQSNIHIYIYNIGALTVNIEFMWRGLETGERMSFSESFHPFRAEPHKFYIYPQYTNIVFILQ